MKLVLFDFDNTLTTKDSLWGFLFFSRGRFAVLASIIILAPFFICYGLRLMNGGMLKEKLLRWHFKGEKQEVIEGLAREFNSEIISKSLRAEVLGKLVDYKNNGDEVCIVSASCDVWIKPFCEQYNCSYLTTEMEFNHGSYSGKFRTPNCNGEEKSVRIRAAYNLSGFEKVIAFGNSSGDAAMFALAHEIHKV